MRYSNQKVHEAAQRLHATLRRKGEMPPPVHKLPRHKKHKRRTGRWKPTKRF